MSINIQTVQLSFGDLKKAAMQYRAWLYLGFWEVKQRYQRSVLGPWWITISMVVFILAMGAVFGRLFSQGMSSYLPFFTAGFLFWSFISTTINESADLFKSNSGFIKQIKLPYHLYVFKLFVKNIIILAHNLVVYFFVIWFCKVNPGWCLLMTIPGFCLLVVNLYWVSLLVALLSARYRDLVPIVQSSLQILFFATPISWMPRLLQDSWIVKYNPLVFLLDLVRQPLLGEIPALHVWVITGLFACGGVLFSFLLFSLLRLRIPFWVD